MKKRFFVVAAAMISSQLWAQDTTNVKVLDEATVTTNKYQRRTSETGKVVTIITRSQLERSNGKTLGELLNTIAGTTILGTNNNVGTNLTASIRGASAGNTLILVDGIPVMDPSVNNNYFDLNLILNDQVERIEILKGGQSTLYGSDAVAGVINIILKKGIKEKTFNATLTGGSYGTFKQSLDVSGASEAFDYSAGYTHLSSKGFSTAKDSTGHGRFDKDGLDQHVLTGRLGFKLAKRLRAFVSSTYSYYKTDLDAALFRDEKDYTVKNKNARIGAGLSYTHNKGVLRFNYNMNYVERFYYDDSVSKSSPFVDWSKARYIGRSHYAELFNNWKWNNMELLAGIDFRYNNTDQYYRYQSPPFPPYTTTPSISETSLRGKNMSQISPYASLVFKNGNGFTGEIGARWNHHSEYGSNFTFTLNPSYLIADKVKIFGNLYTAYKTPTLYQLFDPSAGNTNLKPERGIIGEAGFEIPVNQPLSVRMVGFYRNTKNAIQYVYIDPANYVAKYLNLTRQENYGLELEANYTGRKVTTRFNYTYTDGKTRSPYDGTGMPVGKDTSYYNLYRIPKHAANLNVGVQATKAFFVSTQFHIISKREEFIYGATPEAMKGYMLIDLYSEYRFNKTFKAFVDLKNITDKKYVDFKGFNTRAFNVVAGINLQF